MQFVLDCSVTMAWCFEDETDEYAEGTLDALRRGQAWVPRLWSLEVSNVLLVAERKKRLTVAESTLFLELLRSLPIALDEDDTEPRWMDSILAFGRQHGLSSYDAAYLELAVRYGVPLATRDKALRAACKKAGALLARP